MSIQTGLRIALNNKRLFSYVAVLLLLGVAVFGVAGGVDEYQNAVNSEIDTVESNQPWYLQGTMPVLIIVLASTLFTAILCLSIGKLRTLWGGDS